MAKWILFSFALVGTLSFDSNAQYQSRDESEGYSQYQPRDYTQGRWGYPPTNAMYSVRTSYPGVSCALVDNRPNAELLSAIKRLTEAVKPAAECQNDVDLVKAHEHLKSLFESTAALQDLWKNPEQLNAEGNLARFQTQLESSIRGMDRLGHFLSSNAFLNNKCAKGNMGVSDVFVAFTDLVTAFAPFALVGASMNPSLGVALPYVLGITGVGSAAKIINKMLLERSLDASKPEIREAILTNLCEYTKIADKVRFIKLAQSGQLADATQELQSIGANRILQLFLMQTDEVKTLIQTRNNLRQELDSLTSSLQQDQLEYASFKAELGNQSASPIACEMTRQLFVENSQFPARTVFNYKRLLAIHPQPTTTQLALQRTEESLRTQFMNVSGLETCAQLGLAYVEVIGKIIRTSRDIHKQILREQTKLLAKGDKSFADYVRKEEKAEGEASTAKRVAQILQQLNQDNAVLDKVEIHNQLATLKAALLGRPDSLVSSTARTFRILGISPTGSPAFEYLKFVNEQQEHMVAQFDRGMTSLIEDVIAYRPLFEPFALRQPGKPQGQRSSPSMQDVANELLYRSELKPIDLKLLPLNSEPHRRMCQRLENLWLSWAAVMDHLAAQAFFCEQIRPLFDGDTDPDLLQHCDGTTNIVGRQIAHSGMTKVQKNLVKQGYKGKAILVSEKLTELECPMPDGLVVMQKQ